MTSFPPGLLADLRSGGAILLLAFVLCHAIASVYCFTHRGLTYAQTFVQTLVMGGVVTALMMMVIGNNLVWGIGVMGALALVRFRTSLRDSRDMIFVFASLVTGIACGTRSFALATLGALAFCLVAVYLAYLPFAARRTFDGLLRFTAPWGEDSSERASLAMRTHCRQFVLATIREVGQGELSESVYHLRFKSDDSRQRLARELAAVPGLSGVELLMDDTREEAAP